MTGSEAQLTRQCIQLLKQMKKDGQPVFWLKVHGSPTQRAGEPDLSITYHGLSIKAELKRPGHKPTPLQALRLDQWRQAGAITGVCHSVEQLEELLQRAKSIHA